MLIDMALLAAFSWLVAKALNMVFFKAAPASNLVTWTLTIGYLVCGVILASVAKSFRHAAISKSLGISMSAQNPIDMATAFIMALIFYQVLNRASKKLAESSVQVNGAKADLPVRTPTETSMPAGTSIQSAVIPQRAPTDQPARATPSSSLVLESMQETIAVDEGAIYTAIANELESGAIDKGLWTRLFAECEGDENRTKVAYIKQRAGILIALEQSRLAEIKRQCDEETARLEKARLEGLSLRQQLAAGDQSDETKEKLKLLSGSYTAVMFRGKVRNNLLYDVELLLNDNPLLIAVTNSDGNTPLHLSILEKYVKMSQLLLERAAPTYIENNNGDTPLNLALKTGNKALIALFSAVS